MTGTVEKVNAWCDEHPEVLFAGACLVVIANAVHLVDALRLLKECAWKVHANELAREIAKATSEVQGG